MPAAFFTAVALLQYAFPIGASMTYDVNVVFDGFIPILGGQEGKVEVKMDVGLECLKPDTDGNLRASSEIVKAQILFNDAPLPLTVENIRDFFPKSAAEFSADGKIVKNDAPNMNLPIKLPGLDVKRFPDITFLPVEFPKTEVVEGGSWEFERLFGDSPMRYKAVLQKLTETVAELKIEVNQSYEVLEDEAVGVVKDAKDAIASVKTTMKGSGTAKFDRKLGLFSEVQMAADAESIVTDLKTNATKTRKLTSKLAVKLTKPKPA